MIGWSKNLEFYCILNAHHRNLIFFYKSTLLHKPNVGLCVVNFPRVWRTVYLWYIKVWLCVPSECLHGWFYVWQVNFWRATKSRKRTRHDFNSRCFFIFLYADLWDMHYVYTCYTDGKLIMNSEGMSWIFCKSRHSFDAFVVVLSL